MSSATSPFFQCFFPKVFLFFSAFSLQNSYVFPKFCVFRPKFDSPGYLSCSPALDYWLCVQSCWRFNFICVGGKHWHNGLDNWKIDIIWSFCCVCEPNQSAVWLLLLTFVTVFLMLCIMFFYSHNKDNSL